jgi:glycosyltransferase involved in cell wall biosynthesis
MRLMVDGRWLHQGGIGQFARNILQRCPAGVTLRIVDPHRSLADPASPYRLWREIERHQPDLFWSPNYVPPLRKQSLSIISIHDLITLEFGAPHKRFYFNNVIRPLARRCRRIITVSNHSKRLIIDWLDVPAELVRVVPNGVSEAFFQPTSGLRLAKPYFLYVGNHRAYKNIPRMLTAFKQSRLDEDFLFLLSGTASAELAALITRLRLEDSVIFGGWLRDDELPSIYTGAAALVFVSLSEGFGIPNIEAFATRTPVITSNSSAIPEIVEDGALLVDPGSVEEISRALQVTAAGGQNIERLKDRGQAIARKYSWEKSADLFWSDAAFRLA